MSISTDDEKSHHVEILSKICVVWHANPSLSFFELLAILCGGGTTTYILHTFKDGHTEDIETKTFSHIIEVDDEELEAALDDIID